MANKNQNSIGKKKYVDVYSPLYLTRMYRKREKTKGIQPYRIDWGDFSPKSVEMRSRGPGWRKEEEVKRFARTPHLLYREEARRIAAQKRELGPGTYDLPDPIRELGRKPGSIKGVMDSGAPRFKDSYTDVPPPGTYGKGGVPDREFQEGLTRSPGNVGMLDCCGKINPLIGGSGLAPNRYEPRSSSIQAILDKVVSLRGPYETFSTDRSVYNVGYLATGKSPYIGTSLGVVDSFLEKWFDDDHRWHGKFSRAVARPARPTDRMFLVDPVLAYKDPSFPAPGSYDPPLPKWESPSRNGPPFLSTSSRDDRKSMALFMGNNNPVVVGRYRPEKYNPKTVNGCSSAFISKTQPPDMKAFLVLNERIRAKNQPQDWREHLLKPLEKRDILQKARTLLPCQTGQKLDEEMIRGSRRC